MRSWLQKMEKIADDAKKIRDIKEETENIKKHIGENKLLLLDCLISAGYKDENLNENALLSQIMDISADIVEKQESLKAKKDKLSQSIEDAEEKASSVAAQIEYYSEKYIRLRLVRDILNKEIAI
jgi:hypothetical protein